ncbi:hypothetical protein RJ640_024777 [Escallonia rubra]|uniref:Endonuclease/exonuclease/phosphatase domain-containing protein n=1 Tax=Escallonia rubra TaxID=112253 RepID=A0AA88U981_9ASTE|nr:hypothetical protein RJ640_024777 [Escallonia rubra]
MSCLSWNCCGLGNPRTIRELEGRINKEDPHLVFLSETRCRSRKLEFLKNKWGMHGLFVNPNGLSGGLALLWKNEVNVAIQSFSQNHIDATIGADQDNFKWRFTGFYGHPQVAKRMESWNLLRRLKGRDCLPWLCGGDFNEILRQDEKEGRAPKSNLQMRNFREALDDCDLADLEYSGFKYTWCNNQIEPATVRERLDRFCATAEWMNVFPNAKVRHLNTIASDHSPILLYLKDDCTKANMKVKKQFRFESMWLRKEQCSDIIKLAWEKTEEGCPFKTIASKIKDCRVGLLRWNRTTIGNVQARIRATLDKLATIKGNPITMESKQCESELLLELDELRNMEDDFWKQRSHKNWGT